MKSKFERLIQAHDQLSLGEKIALDRRVPTRWNSEYDCIKAHIYFRAVVETLTNVTENQLKAYKLTESQWILADDVGDVLQVGHSPRRRENLYLQALLIDLRGADIVILACKPTSHL